MDEQLAASNDGPTWYVMDADAWWGQQHGRELSKDGSHEISRVREQAKTPAEQLFETLDADGNGVIDRSEFLQSMALQEKPSYLLPQKPRTPLARGTTPSMRQKAATLRTVEVAEWGQQSADLGPFGRSNGNAERTEDPEVSSPAHATALCVTEQPSRAWESANCDWNVQLRRDLKTEVPPRWVSSGGGTGSCGTSPFDHPREPLSPDSLSPRARSPDNSGLASFDSPQQKAGVHKVTAPPPDDVPMVATRLVETVVAEEVAGLGECLNICAQRSRTLKLLGFQHLHFDARLQSFLHDRAVCIVHPIIDAFLLFRALFAWREAARNKYLWAKIKKGQGTLHDMSLHQEELLRSQQAIRCSAKEKLILRFNKDVTVFLQIAVTEWSKYLQHAKSKRLKEEMEKLSAHAKLDEDAKDQMRQKAIQTRLAVFKSLDVGAARDYFLDWRQYTQARHNMRVRTKIWMHQHMVTSQWYVNQCFKAWADWLVQEKEEKLTRGEARKNKMTSFVKIAAQARQDGILLHSVVQEWSRVARYTKQRGNEQVRVLGQIAQMRDFVLTSAFKGWHGLLVENREGRQKRMRKAERGMQAVASSATALAFRAWVQCHSHCQESKRTEDHVFRTAQMASEALVAFLFRWWSRFALKERLARLSADNERLLRMMLVDNKALGGGKMGSARRLMTGSGPLAKAFSAWHMVPVLRREHDAQKQLKIQEIFGDQSKMLKDTMREWCTNVAQARLMRTVEEAEHLKATQAQELAELQRKAREDKKNAILRQLAGSLQAACGTALAAWREITASNKRSAQLRENTRVRAEHAALRSAEESIKSAFGACWAAWVKASMVTKAHKRQELAKSSVQRQLIASQEHLRGVCLAGWQRWVQKSKNDKQRNWAVVNTFEQNNRKQLLLECLKALIKATESAKNQRLQRALEDTRRLLEQEQDAAAKTRQRCKAEGMRRLMQSGSSLTKSVLTAWKAAIKALRAAHHNEAVGTRLANKSSLELQVDVFAMWSTQATHARSARLKERSKMAIKRQIMSGRQQILGACIAGWLSVLQAGRVSMQRKEQGRLAAKRRAMAQQEPLLLLCFDALRAEVAEAQQRLQYEGLLNRQRARAKQGTHSAIERALAESDRACVARLFLAWRLLSWLQSTVQLEQRRLARCTSMTRSFAVKTRSRMQEIRCLYRWLLAIYLRDAWPEKYGTSSGVFLNKEPPTFFVKPVAAKAQKQDTIQLQMHRPGSPRPRVTSLSPVGSSERIQIWKTQTDAPTALEEPEVCTQGTVAAAAVAVASALSSGNAEALPERNASAAAHGAGSAGIGSTLAPNDRYTLASQAATSDGAYRRLLAHNKGQIRQSRASSPRGAPERVVGWGVWAT